MVVFSTLRSQLGSVNLLGRKSYITDTVIKRYAGGGHKLTIEISNFKWRKTRDLFSLYTCIAAFMYGSIIIYANVFVGSPILAEIPEGYRPKHWEYYCHPISRFIQRYGFSDPQMEYEKTLHHLYEEDERKKMRDLDNKIRATMKRRKDYQAYYYRPLTSMADYIRHDYKEEKIRESMSGLTAADLYLPPWFEEGSEGGQLDIVSPRQFGPADGNFVDELTGDFRDYSEK